MDDPRPEKVAVVEEVKQRLSAADATVLTDYRGIDVPGMAELRRSLRAVGGEVKIYKNTLVRFAARDLGLELDELLVGPTALAFVGKGEDGTGDPVLVAKAIRDFAKGHPSLQVKGGLLGERLLTADEIDQLARVAPRDELLARFAGGLAAPLQKMAGLLEALPRNFAYGLAALIEQGGGVEGDGTTGADSTETEADETDGGGTDGADDAPATEDAAPEADETDGGATEGADDAPATEDAAPDTEDAAPATEDAAPEDAATDTSTTPDQTTDDSDSEEG